jgi:two-component system OmpR family sensor kinase
VTGPAGGADAPVLARLRRARLAAVPLRFTLVALLVALVAVALLATGITSTSLLRGYLLQQRDTQLHLTVAEIEHDPDHYLPICFGRAMQYPSSNYLACLPPKADELIVLLGPTHDPGVLPAVDEYDPTAGGGLTTVQSSDGSTSWRLAATQPLTGGYRIVVGLDLEQDLKALSRLATLEIVVGLVVLVLLGAAGYGLVRNSLRPLASVERTALAIAAGDLSQRVPVGDDRTEVGRLSAALNGMLSRIESAFRAQQASEAQARGSEDRMRRFVADASHELRTPLTSIRGFAELYRQGAVGSPEETRHLMERIEAEGARMGLLVEDLLLLARLDQQRPLSIGPVDLARITGDAVQAARATAPDRPISFHLDDSLTEAPVVAGDEARLRQVVGNLVTNALIHTPDDSRVSVSLAQESSAPDVLTLTVADEGPGMDPADAARAFERFYRADSSRARAGGGTGLGLAIVASLVAAHGGTVHLTTAPGAGAVFTVRLPKWAPGGAASDPR